MSNPRRELCAEELLELYDLWEHSIIVSQVYGERVSSVVEWWLNEHPYDDHELVLEYLSRLRSGYYLKNGVGVELPITIFPDERAASRSVLMLKRRGWKSVHIKKTDAGYIVYIRHPKMKTLYLRSRDMVS